MNDNILIFDGGMYDMDYTYRFVKDFDYDYVICADAGLATADSLGVKVDLIVGDFDSINHDILNKYIDKGTKVLKFPVMKDESDLELTLKEAIKLKPKSVTILGATGGRIDHLICNINVLYMFLKENIPCYISDKYSDLHLIDKGCKLLKSERKGKYVSFIPYTDVVKNLTLKGFKYNVKGLDMKREGSLGLSNEIEDETAYISFDEGVLMVIESHD